MEIKEEKKIPSFFDYDPEDDARTDIGYETLQDFFLSWTIRCSEIKYKNINPTLHEYARRSIIGLIYGYNNDKDEFVIDEQINNSFQVVSANTYRQWKNIDILVEIEITYNNKAVFFVFNIENKWYSSLRNGQLEKYKKIVEKYYRDKNYEIINLFITLDDCRENYEEEKRICRDHKFKFLTVFDIKSSMKLDKETGNALFDEYWFNFLKEEPEDAASSQAT